MKKAITIMALLALLASAGCASRPISKTIHGVKRVYSTTKQVYSATKSVANLVNPLEYIYVSVPTDPVTGPAAGPGEIWVYDRQSGELIGRIAGGTE